MLTFKDLRAANVARCQSPSGFNHPLNKWSVAEWGNAAAGECGEACNIAKKLIRFRDGVPGNKKTEEDYKQDLANEIADTIIYMDLWAASLDIDIETSLQEVFNSDEEWNINAPIPSSFEALRAAVILHDSKYKLLSLSVAEWGNAVIASLGKACHAAVLLHKKNHRRRLEDLAYCIADTLTILDAWAYSQGIILEDAVREAFNNKSDALGYEGKI